MTTYGPYILGNSCVDEKIRKVANKEWIHCSGNCASYTLCLIKL